MFIDNIDLWVYGIRTTLLLAILGTIIGLFIALIIVVMKIQTINKNTPLLPKTLKMIAKRFASMYVGFFRGTPMIVQGMLFYYGMFSLGVNIPIIGAGLIVVSLNTSAYLTEVIRAGLNGLDKGQTEASLSLGLTTGQTYRKVLFPQALRNMIPAIGNELVVNIKDTAVLSVIGVAELFYISRSVGSSAYNYVNAFLIVSLLYLILVHIAIWLLELLTKQNIDQKSQSEGAL